jgi:hypothetical protein
VALTKLRVGFAKEFLVESSIGLLILQAQVDASQKAKRLELALALGILRLGLLLTPQLTQLLTFLLVALLWAECVRQMLCGEQALPQAELVVAQRETLLSLESIQETLIPKGLLDSLLTIGLRELTSLPLTLTVALVKLLHQVLTLKRLLAHSTLLQHLQSTTLLVPLLLFLEEQTAK